LQDDDLLDLIKKKDEYAPEAIAAMKTVGMERGLINEKWEII
jgi:hypothetical protein